MKANQPPHFFVTYPNAILFIFSFRPHLWWVKVFLHSKHRFAVQTPSARPQRSNSPYWLFSQVPRGYMLLVWRVILHMTALTSVPVWISAAPPGQESLESLAASSLRISWRTGTGLLYISHLSFSVWQESQYWRVWIHLVLVLFSSTVYILKGYGGVCDFRCFSACESVGFCSLATVGGFPVCCLSSLVEVNPERSRGQNRRFFSTLTRKKSLNC